MRPLVPACRREPCHFVFSRTPRTAHSFSPIQSVLFGVSRLGLLPGQFPWEAISSFSAAGGSGSRVSGSCGVEELDRAVLWFVGLSFSLGVKSGKEGPGVSSESFPLGLHSRS